MKKILITPKSEEEQAFLNALLMRLGIDAKVLPEEAIEDVGLAMLMRESDRSERVSEKEIMDKLKR
jgi:hypothetical protein